MVNKPSRGGVRGTLGGGRLTSNEYVFFSVRNWLGRQIGKFKGPVSRNNATFPQKEIARNPNIKGLLDKMLGKRILVLYLKDLTLS